MNFLNNMKIGLRLNLILSLVMLIIISTFGIYIINSQKDKIIEDTDLRMVEQVEDISRIVEMQTKSNQENVQKSLDIAKTLMESYGGISIIEGNDDSNSSSETVSGWYLKDQNILENNDFVDEIARLTNATVSIFEKQSNGFKRISTSLVNEKGKRQIGTIVSSNSDVSITVSGGQDFYGRAIVLDEWDLTAYSSIWFDGKIIGMLGIGIKEKDLHGLREIFSEKKYFETGYPFLIDNKGVLIIHPTKEGENQANQEFFKQLINSSEKTGKMKYFWEGKMKYQYYKYVDAIESFVSVSIYETELLDIIEKTKRAIVFAVIIGILIFVIINTLVSRNITKALNEGVEFASRISSGDLKTTLDINQKDEIGLLSTSLNKMVEKLREIVSNINAGANNIASASLQVSSATQQLSQGASEQASASEEVSSSMEQMAANIQQNTDNAQQTEKIAINASEGINKVAGASQESLSSMQQISEKITIVNDIAFQTNILALNAAVEAARAGEHGKGFAVVAAEVRKLAERSKIAADEINILSSRSLKVTEEAGDLMTEIMPEIDKTAKLVQEISAASLEQNSGADQINSAVQQLSQVTQQNAAASEEMATSAEELSAQSEQLRDAVSFFKIDDKASNSFIGTTQHKEYPQKQNIANRLPKPDNGSNKKPKKELDGIKIEMHSDDFLDNDFETYK